MTLIELMIVVAIIAILAAIALPNFFQAQARAKVTRVKSDMRALAVGLEAFAVDNNGYPPANRGLHALKKPVEYLTMLPDDVFRAGERVTTDLGLGYLYGSMPIENATRFALLSVGLDTDVDVFLGLTTGPGAGSLEPDLDAIRFYPGYSAELFSEQGAPVNGGVFKYSIYDPTNGAMSDGDIYRLSDHPLE